MCQIQNIRSLIRNLLSFFFVGYPEGNQGYKVYNLDTKKFLRSHDVVFLENSFGHKSLEGEKDANLLINESYFNPKFDYEDSKDQVFVNNQDDVPDIPQGRPQRNRVAPDRPGVITSEWWNYINYVSASTIDVDEPNNIKEAYNGLNAIQWKNATYEEYNSLMKNHTWDSVELAEGKNIVGCKWIFKVKQNVDGSVDRCKAGLVAQGFSQQAEEDYDDIFAPVARYSSIRSVLAIANELNLNVHQMDVKTAFLNGELDNEIYMKQPEEYVNKEHPNYVCKLNKSLYGLKQAARCWNLTVDKFLKSDGYDQSPADPCIYIKIEERDGKQCIMIIAVYMDDTVLASNNDEMLESEKAKLNSKFEKEDRGPIHYCLGMLIQRDKEAKVLTISQKAYLENVLKHSGMFDCKPMSTPMEANKKFDKLPNDQEPEDVQRFQAAIGLLTYASIATRPDISSAVGALSQKIARPGPEHWSGVKRVFHYIKGTVNYSLKYVASDQKDIMLNGFSDADWAGDTSTRKSTSGYLFRLGKSTISWKLKRQSIVALSSTEAVGCIVYC